MAKDMNTGTTKVSELALLTSLSRAKSKSAGSLRPRFIPIDDACRYAGIGRSKFYRDFLWRLRTVRIGRRNLIELDSLDELLDQLTSESETGG